MNANSILNRLLVAGRALLLGLSFLFGPAQATGVSYDGIYQWSPGNFLSLHQDGTHMIATIYFTHDGTYTFPAQSGGGVLPVPTLDLFDLMDGQITGSTAQVFGTRFHRACHVGYNFTFNNDATITVTRLGESNTAVADASGISCSSIVGMEAATLIVPKIRFNTNSPPVASAGSSQNVVTGSIVNLDGSASSDAEGDTLTYLWTLTSRPSGSSASLSSLTSAKPTFTADVAGTYIAYLTVNDGTVSSTPATAIVTANAVTADTVRFIAVAPLNRTISLGETRQYFATATLASGATKDVSATVIWVSSNTAVATINGTGFATSVGQGNTTITASIAGRTASTPLTVGVVALTGVAIGGSMSYTIFDGQTLQLTATAYYSDGSNRDITQLASWSAPFTELFGDKVATVSNATGMKGLVTTLGTKGTTPISVGLDGVGDTVFVRVQ